MERINDTDTERTGMRRPNVALISVCVAVALAVVAVVGGIAWFTEGYSGSTPERIYLRRGTTPEGLRDMLTSRFGSYGGKVYSAWRILGGGDSIYGSYVIEPDMSAVRAANMIHKYRQTPVKFTFNNLRTVGQLCARVACVMECDSAAFAAAVDSLLPLHGYDRAEAPAAFVPDSYEFYWTASPAQIVETLVSYRDRFWNDSRRAKAEALGLTPVEVAIVASIVEEETSKSDERPVVARLYLNRLQRGIKLQADPTVKFAIGDFSLRRIKGKHLSVDSPYNTYRHEGLPPGPIRIPDKMAIDAVLSAPKHDYIFMCAKEDFSGYHNFAVDGATHMANARRYQQALNRRGIQ